MKKLAIALITIVLAIPLTGKAQSSWKLSWKNSNTGADTILGKVASGRSVLAGVDLNKNGKSEIYVTAYKGPSVAMYEYTGKGDTMNFVQMFPVAPVTYSASNQYEPRDIHWGDLDKDGNLELIYPVGRLKSNFPVGQNAMYRGYEDWEWSPDSNKFLGPYTIIGDTSEISFRPENFWVADVDQDGIQEIVDPTYSYYGTDGKTFDLPGEDGVRILSVSGTFESGFWTVSQENYTKTAIDTALASTPLVSIPAHSDGTGYTYIWTFANGYITPYTYIFPVVGTAPNTYLPDSYNKPIVLKVNNSYPLKNGCAADFNGDGRQEVYFTLFKKSAGTSSKYPSYGNPNSLWVLGNITGPSAYDSTNNLRMIVQDTSTYSAWYGPVVADSANKRLFVGAYYRVFEVDYKGGDPMSPSSYSYHSIYTEPGDSVIGSGVTGMQYVDLRGDGKKELVLSYVGVSDSVNRATGNVKPLRILEETATGVWEPWTVITPSDYQLSQNYPNPFNPTTTISFSLPIANRVSVKIYDVQGKEIRTLLNSSLMSKGSHSVVWDGKDNHGLNVASGVYFYTLEFGGYRMTKKMTLLK
ncbi:MAG: FG-GAP-like repeat-containing protein [Candidatus Kryptoniota bacterium]